MEEYRLLRKKYAAEKKTPVYKKMIFSFINRVLFCILLFLVALILTKNKFYKEQIYKYVYQDHIPFLELEKFYQTYLGKLIPDFSNKKDSDTEMVSSVGNGYDQLEEIENGVLIHVSKGAAISAVESGLVLFLGDKDGLSNVLILEQVDGVEAWYVGVDVTNYKLYDYIEKDTIVGSSLGDTISIYFKRKGESVDYKNYLS